MKLVVIYGPPAAGKLTVAEELSRLTGYRILHNHMTRNLIGSIVGYDNPQYQELSYLFRKKLVEAAAKSALEGLIFTFVYGAESGKESLMKEMAGKVKSHGGNTYLVQLHCSANELRRRVMGKSRRRHEKITDVKTLDSELAKYDFYSQIRGFRSLSIDNTNLNAKAVAKRIKAYYKL